MVKYKYDAWGRSLTTVVDSSASEIANLNPFRYRSYYFDTETNLYFLKTRYYDPEIGRFMTIDDISYLDPDSINGLNLYAYCLNNPIKYSDPNGTLVITTAAIISALIATAKLMAIGFAIGATVGGGFEIGKQIYANGWNINDWNWVQIGRSALGGGIAGAITAIPVPGFKSLGLVGKILSYGITFSMGGIGSVLGGWVSGSVDFENRATVLSAFFIGAFANVMARGVTDVFANVKASNIFNQSNKAKSLAVQKLQGHRLNMGAKALSGTMRNAFKGATKDEIIKLLFNASPWFRLGIYSGIISSVLSGWY